MRSDRDQFRKNATGLGICMLATISVGCSPAGSDVSTTVEVATTAAATASASTAPATTSSPSTEPTLTEDSTTTTSPEPASGVVVGSGGVLGWWNGAFRPANDAAAVPLEDGATFQIVGPTGVIGTAVGGVPETGCEIVEGHVILALEPDPYRAYDPFASNPLAVSADWDLVPQAVAELPLDSEVYAQIVSDHLSSRGFLDDDPEIVQLYRVDFEGDGADEVVIVADNHNGAFYQQGVYSIVLVRSVIEEEVQTTVLHESIVGTEPLGETEIPFSVVARVAAIADLDNDGAMEIALDSAYYEGAGTEVWDYVDDDLGFVSVLLTGCGA